MTPSASESRLRRLWSEGRDYVTHWVVAGTLIAITGFAPEHWIAGLLERLSFPELLRHGRLPGFDLRVAFVALGVAIVAWDVVRRGRTTQRPEPASTVRSAAMDAPSRGRDAERRPHAAEGTPLTLPDKPSIAVLPFTNMRRGPPRTTSGRGRSSRHPPRTPKGGNLACPSSRRT